DNIFESWLEPVLGHGVEAAAGHAHGAGLEFGLMVCSVAVAAFGVFVAYCLYFRGRPDPAVFSNVLGGRPYRAGLNKDYVDEAYQAIFVNGCLALASVAAAFDRYVIDDVVNGSAAVVRGVSQVGGILDKYVVDGAVNAVADGTQMIGRRARAIQSGTISAY